MSKPHVFLVLMSHLEDADADVMRPLLENKVLEYAPTSTGFYLPKYKHLPERLFASEKEAEACCREHHKAMHAAIGVDDPEEGVVGFDVHKVTLAELEPWPEAQCKFVELVYGGYDFEAMAKQVRALRVDYCFGDDLRGEALSDSAQQHLLIGLSLLEQAAAHFELAQLHAERDWTPKP